MHVATTYFQSKSVNSSARVSYKICRHVLQDIDLYEMFDFLSKYLRLEPNLYYFVKYLRLTIKLEGKGVTLPKVNTNLTLYSLVDEYGTKSSVASTSKEQTK